MKPVNSAALAATAVLACATLLFGGEKVNKPSLPDNIAKLVRQYFPSATTVDTDVGDDDDQIEYRVRVKLPPDGLGARMEIREDIGVTSLEEQMRQEQLPPRVRKALERDFPGARFRDAHKQSEIRVTYELELVIDGKRREVTLSPRGKVLEVD